MLMSAGLALPRQVFGHGWVHWKGQKMSKSLGTVLDPLEAADRLGPDPLRLYLTKEIGYGQDGDFTWERFEERYNVDLANNFGNLVSRFTSMAHRYRKGRLVPPAKAVGPLAARADAAVGRYREAMESFALHHAVAAAFDLIDATNEFIASSEPWAVAKDPSRAADLDQQLYEIGEAVRIAALLLLPVMPSSCAEVLRRVGETREVGSLRLDADAAWSTSGERVVVKGDALWPRLDPSRAPAAVRVETRESKETKAMEPSSMSPQPATPKPAGQPPAGAQPASPKVAEVPPATPMITIDDFAKLDLRVGRVVAAEPVPKSRKLLKVQIDTGTGERQVVAGIAGAYEPEVLVGRTVVFVANLKPVTLAGVESNGMMLAASAPGGKPVLLTVDDADAAPPGSKVS